MSSLVLNATFEPVSFISPHRAICLVVTNKAELLEYDESRLFRSEKLTIPYPKVIRLKFFVEIPRFLRKKVSRQITFARDKYSCQYCGRLKKNLKRDERLTIDHVKPKSLGGKTEWENVVTACNTCNDKKGDKLPYECHMLPIKTPREPRYVAVILIHKADEEQLKYFEGWL